MEQIYHTVYSWLNHETIGGDRHLLSGIDCNDGVFDGITLLRNVIDSLHIVRPEDSVLQAQRYSEKISEAKFIMRQGGMRAFIGEVEQHMLALNNIGKPLSDAEVLGRVKRQTTGKHAQIDRVWRDLRIESRKTNTETTFLAAKSALINAFTYDVPTSDKTETVKANFTPRDPTGDQEGIPKKRARGDGNSRGRNQKRFPKGSCKNCPEATNHTTYYCYLEIRKRRNKPKDEIWCTVHKRGVHYDSECRRHKRKGNKYRRGEDNKNTSKDDAKTAAMLAMSLKSQIDALVASTKQPPRTARVESTAIDVKPGPRAVSPPSQVFANIASLSPKQKLRLQSLLQNEA